MMIDRADSARMQKDGSLSLSSFILDDDDDEDDDDDDDEDDDVIDG
jgi:hypothetical protein